MKAQRRCDTYKQTITSHSLRTQQQIKKLMCCTLYDIIFHFIFRMMQIRTADADTHTHAAHLCILHAYIHTEHIAWSDDHSKGLCSVCTSRRPQFAHIFCPSKRFRIEREKKRNNNFCRLIFVWPQQQTHSRHTADTRTSHSWLECNQLLWTAYVDIAPLWRPNSYQFFFLLQKLKWQRRMHKTKGNKWKTCTIGDWAIWRRIGIFA